jgi:hypothetical protein
LNERSVLTGEVGKSFIIVQEGETSTVVGAPRPALDCSFGVHHNNDLVTTSILEEWSHSWDVETVVVFSWFITGLDVKFHSSRQSKSTIVRRKHRFLGSFGVGVDWETVDDLQCIIFHSGLGDGVEMQKGHNRWRRSLRTGHRPEDVDKILVGGSQWTSSSDCGEGGCGHIHDLGERNGDQSVHLLDTSLLVVKRMANLVNLVDSEELEFSTRHIALTTGTFSCILTSLSTPDGFGDSPLDTTSGWGTNLGLVSVFSGI